MRKEPQRGIDAPERQGRTLLKLRAELAEVESRKTSTDDRLPGVDDKIGRAEGPAVAGNEPAVLDRELR